jgi:transposase
MTNWWDVTINSFRVVDVKRMSNGPMESLNGRLKWFFYDGYEYSNFEKFRNRLMFCLNKDEPRNFK